MGLVEMLRDKMDRSESVLVSFDTESIRFDVEMRVYDFYIDDDGWYYIEDENDNDIHFNVKDWEFVEKEFIYVVTCKDETKIMIQA